MRQYGKWNVKLPDESYVWEPDEVTLGEQLMLENEAETTYDEWISDVGRHGKAIPCQILVWFLRRKAGKQEDRMTVEFPIRKLEITSMEEDEDDPEAPAGSEPATSEPSSPADGADPPSSTSSPAQISAA